MEAAKSELEDLNSRFAAYVNRVKQLKDENDMKTLMAAIETLEGDLRSLKASYECQISHLSNSLRIITEEKYELERELIARKDNDSHFMDRISLESSKNAKLLLDISAIKSEVSEKEHEITALKLRIRQLQLDAGDGKSLHTKLKEEISDLTQKLIFAEDSQANLSNQVASMSERLSAQEKMSNERVMRLKRRLDWYISQFAAYDARMQEVSKREAAIPELLDRLRKTAREELRHHQQQTTNFYKKSLSVLQSQLQAGRNELRYLKSEKHQAEQNNLELQKQIADLTSKVSNLDNQNALLEDALKTAQNEIIWNRKVYEEKLHGLEEAVAAHASEAETAQDDFNFVRSEIARLQNMLATEEKRLNIATIITSNQKQLTTKENDELVSKNQTSDKTWRTNQDVSLRRDVCKTENCVTIEVDEPVSLSQHTGDENSGTKILSTEPFESKQEVLDDDVQLHHFSGNNKRGCGYQAASCLPKSGRSSADAKVLPDGQKNNMSPQSRSLRSTVPNSNAIGSLHICEVDPEGRYIRLWNSSDTVEHDISFHTVQQIVDGSPVSLYSFGPDTRLLPRCIITLWANCVPESGKPHDSQNEFYCKEVSYWSYGPLCTTMLCNPAGQVLAWLSPPYRSLSGDKIPNKRLDSGLLTDVECVLDSPISERTENKLPRFLRQHSCDAVLLTTQKLESGTSSTRQCTPDTITEEYKTIRTKHDASPNAQLPACMCEIRKRSLFSIKRLPERSCLLIQPEYPSSLGLRLHQKSKASPQLRSPTCGLLNRPQMTYELRSSTSS
ncbi:unnamed protein product [Calicophoron daubneyi]|uniref:LTD domain-containing protein n=1 Tax=Calicophoron daubneyi TaxID=300641 RepID=A0AAV2TMX5_CALDB